jgi:choice-of-anchor B domain-containing protein
MKQLLITLSFLSIISMSGQTPCTSGTAGEYPCNGYDLQSFISLDEMDAQQGNDSWGWTDPQDGKEYALIGLDNGTAFIDVSDPVNAVYLGKLPTHTQNSTWRDIKTYNNHAFIVSEASNHGMQVFDLTRLRDVSNPPETFDEDAHYSGFGSAHNVIINEDSGYAYGVGTSTFNGGPHFVDISDPTNPTPAGGYSDDSYSHDAQVVTYSGPDTEHLGKEILIGSNENEIAIVDITNKNNPIGLSTISYSNVEYTHQGWFTEDQRYFIVGDEIDEINVGFNTRTIIFDFEDLDNPSFHFEYEGPTEAIDHNGYVKGDKYYLSNYRAGMRVLDISQIGNESITEIGFFDTYPDSDSANFDGAWNVYPFFASNNIVISDINRGFFLVREPSIGQDTGVVAITSPVTGSGLSDAEVVTIEIQNFGGTTQTSIPVFYSLDGAAPVNETYTGSIAQGATDTYSFITTVDLSEFTDYVFVAGTELTGDDDTSNDDTTAEVSNLGQDTGVVAITSPVTGGGLTNAEVVTIEIQNFGGTTQTSIPVFYSLDGAAPVNETYTGSISQGATDTYSFTTTVDLSELTIYVFVAGTELVGDDDTSNDDTTAEVSTFLCQPEANCTLGDGLTLVSVEEINNPSGCETDGYGDFTDLIANLAQGGTYDITLSTGFGNQFVKVWVDFNNDFTFSNNEVILNNFVIAPGSAAGNYTETTSITIPANATLGSHRMRVKTNWSANVPADACDETTYGETEDYTVNIIDELGAADEAIIDFEIAPNPAKENITITATSEPIKSLEIFNILGQRVLNLTFDATPLKKVNITSFKSGMYLIRINTQITKRLIVK